MRSSSLAIMFCLGVFRLFGQFDGYRYKRELKGIKDEWHRVILPDEMLGKLTPGFKDLRFFGINESNDTIEAPYIIKYLKTFETTEQKEYEVLGVREVGNEYQYIFYFKDAQPINEMNLDFSGDNYDWKVAVDGSNDQKNWIPLVGDYRLIRINNEYSDYAYKDIHLPEGSYHYYRLRIPAAAKPVMILPGMYKKTVHNGKALEYKVVKMKITEPTDDKVTIIDLELKEAVPVCWVNVLISNDYDYFRDMSIEYLADSTKTETGYLKYYRNAGNVTLNSREENSFEFTNSIARHFRLIIKNYDNAPLSVENIVLGGYSYEAVIRFSEPANYFMVYGNKAAPAPQYDIIHFSDAIPAEPEYLTFGTEIEMLPTLKQESKAFFQSKWWLYSLMGIVVVVIGGFTIRMMRSERGGE